MKKLLFREIFAGLSTFFTMAYLLVLVPQLLSQGGWDFGAALTATILTIVVSTIFAALYAGFPVVLGPGLSVLTFLIFSVTTKQLATWEQALGLVFWAGAILFLLSVLRLRQKILLQIPLLIKRACISGIGLFFIVAGLKQIDLGTVWGTPQQGVALAGLALFWILQAFGLRIAFLFPILMCWALSLFFGLSPWQGLFALPPSLSPTFLHLDLSSVLQPHLWIVLLSILLIALFDTGATLFMLAETLGWLDEKGVVRKLDRIVIPDGPSSMLAALLGTTTIAFFAESSSGIRAGGKTAIVALTAAFCSAIALFLYPAISSIPAYATAPTLIGLGCLLSLELRQVDFKDATEWIPALITALTMPLAFSIYRGLAFGFISYAIVKLIGGRWREVRLLVWGLAIVFLIQTLTIL